MITEYIKIMRGTTNETTINVNNIKYTSTSQQKPLSASMVARNQEVCSINGRINGSSYDINVAFPNSNYIIKFFEQSNSINKMTSILGAIKEGLQSESPTGMLDGFLPKICDLNGNQVGNIDLNNNLVNIDGVNLYVYRIYQTNINANPRFTCCIYNDSEQLVGIIQDNPKYKGKITRYTIYSATDQWFKYNALIAIIFDKLYDKYYVDPNNRNRSFTIETTRDPEILAKFDQNFIDQIIQKEGFNNLPDNMPLVSTKIQEAHKASDNKIGKFITIIIVLLVLVFFFVSFFS